MYTFLMHASSTVSEQAQRDWEFFAARQRRNLHPPILTVAYVRSKMTNVTNVTTTSYTTHQSVPGGIPNNPGTQI